jgi:hypothetical protein
MVTQGVIYTIKIVKNFVEKGGVMRCKNHKKDG